MIGYLALLNFPYKGDRNFLKLIIIIILH